MKRIRRYLPRPAVLIGILALILATAGTSYAVGQFGVGKLREGARAKVVGVGKLVYVTTTTTLPATTTATTTTTTTTTPAANPTITTVKATCPTSPIGNLKPIAGGIKLDKNDPKLTVLASHHITNGWEGTVYNDTGEAHTAQVTLACARSIAVSGSTLPTS